MPGLLAEPANRNDVAATDRAAGSPPPANGQPASSRGSTESLDCRGCAGVVSGQRSVHTGERRQLPSVLARQTTSSPPPLLSVGSTVNTSTSPRDGNAGNLLGGRVTSRAVDSIVTSFHPDDISASRMSLIRALSNENTLTALRERDAGNLAGGRVTSRADSSSATTSHAMTNEEYRDSMMEAISNNQDRRMAVMRRKLEDATSRTSRLIAAAQGGSQFDRFAVCYN